MSLRIICRFVLLGTLLFVVSPAIPCDTVDYDQFAPSSTSDRTDRTDKTYFNWSTDVDPRDTNTDRAWHFIQNLHDWRLSVRWDRVGFIIPFDKPLHSSGTSCARDYASKGSFVLDYEAPIITNNDGNKNAVAYVRSSTPVSTRPAIAGAELISHYESTTSIPNVATAVLILRFDAPTRKLEVHVSTGRNKETMAFNPQSVGVDIVEFEHALRNSGAIIVGVTYLSHLFGDDEFSLGALRALADMQSDEFLHFSVNPPTKLYFSLSDSSLEGLGDTALLLLTPNPSSSLIAAKRLYSSHLTR